METRTTFVKEVIRRVTLLATKPLEERIHLSVRRLATFQARGTPTSSGHGFLVTFAKQLLTHFNQLFLGFFLG